MTDRGTNRSWPTEATTLPIPRIGMAVAATLGLSAAFGAFTALPVWYVRELGGIAAAWADCPPCLIAIPLFGTGSALALVAFAWIVASIVRNGPVGHAAASVLPDVPREPVDANNDFFGNSPSVKYVLKPVEHGWWFGPAAAPMRGVRRFGIPWMTFITGGIITIIWLFTDRELAEKSAFTMVGVAAWAAMCAILWFLPKMVRPLPFLTIDIERRVCEIGPAPAISVPLDRVVAVQLCACRFRSEDTIADGVQANLVWLADEAETTHEGRYQRAPLMFFVSEICPWARLAGELAQTLGVPLVCHASREDWLAERAAARLRPVGRSVPPCFPGVRSPSAGSPLRRAT